MPNGKNPLMLMMALSMPGAAHALGLGEIHVDSALNESFAAEIDIVGATALELADLRAKVASREVFVRYGADRPTFLSSATFKVTQDAHGRPVLAVRSTEAFTEPLVNFLVDMNWHNGELVRQYTVLLDPAGFGAARPAETPAVVSAPAAPAAAPAVVTATVAPSLGQVDAAAPQVQPAAEQIRPPVSAGVRKTTEIKVGAKATLRGIAWRIGERSDAGLQRMMIAIFRANPAAFDGNINRLHRGAVLKIPTEAELATLPYAEAHREFHSHMATWRAGVQKPRALAASAAASAAPAAPAAPAARLAEATASASPRSTGSAGSTASDTVPEVQALDHRVQSLEQELNELKGVLQREQEQMLTLQRSVPAPVSESAAVSELPPVIVQSKVPAPADASPAAANNSPILAFVAGFGVLLAAFAALFIRLRRRATMAALGVRIHAAPTVQARADAVPPATAGDTTLDGSALSNATLGNTTLGDAAQDDAAAQDDTTLGDADMASALAAAAANTMRMRTESAEADGAAGDADGAQAAAENTSVSATYPMLPAVRAALYAGRSEISPQDPTVSLRVDTTVNLQVDPTHLDYNLQDLDMTAQHVQMPSALNEHAVVHERRTSLADALQLAIEREPDRHDLRMKLLELYYSAAATNRQAFLEVVQKFARDKDFLRPEQWDKIAYMGRQIAGENPLFADESASEDTLANSTQAA
jgi:pilus assembly protein FimV